MKAAILFICMFFVTRSCNLKKEQCSCIADTCANGFIYWGGLYAADGLGWYFAEKREGNWLRAQLKEEELPNEFKITSDSIAVFICLRQTTERAPCFCASPSYFYKISKIQKR